MQDEAFHSFSAEYTCDGTVLIKFDDEIFKQREKKKGQPYTGCHEYLPRLDKLRDFLRENRGFFNTINNVLGECLDFAKSGNYDAYSRNC
jgi:hypothetical protein